MLKDSFLHLPILLFIFVIVFCAIVGCVLLASWIATYNPAVPYEARWLPSHLPAAAAAALTVSVLVAVFLLFGRIQRKPGNPLLSFLLPLLLCLSIITAGTTLIHGPPGSVAKTGNRAVHPFVPGIIHSIESGMVYVDALSVPEAPADGIRLARVVRYSSGLLTYDRVAAATLKSADDESPAMLIPGSTSQSAVPILPANPVYQPAFEPPDSLATTIAEIRLLNTYLLDLRSRSPESFVLAAFSVSFFAMSCVTFLRLTGWPLLNALFTLSLFRGLFLLFRFFDSDIGMEVIGLVRNEQISRQLPSLVFLALGVLFIAFNLLFVRQPKRREMV